MTTVTVNASKTYQIKIGSGLLKTIGAEAQALGKAQRICIVSDSNVFPLYGAAAEQSLLEAGFMVSSYVFPAGEESKSGTTYLELLNCLASNGLSRSDLIVALGTPAAQAAVGATSNVPIVAAAVMALVAPIETESEASGNE